MVIPLPPKPREDPPEESCMPGMPGMQDSSSNAHLAHREGCQHGVVFSINLIRDRAAKAPSREIRQALWDVAVDLERALEKTSF